MGSDGQDRGLALTSASSPGHLPRGSVLSTSIVLVLGPLLGRTGAQRTLRGPAPPGEAATLAGGAGEQRAFWRRGWRQCAGLTRSLSAAAGPRRALEMGRQHLPALLWADGPARRGADSALGGQHHLQDGLLLLLQLLREPHPGAGRRGARAVRVRAREPPGLRSGRRSGCAWGGGERGLPADAALTLHGQDNILKTSFLSAAVRLTKALKQENRSQSYKFTQIPELIQCLLVSDPLGTCRQLLPGPAPRTQRTSELGQKCPPSTSRFDPQCVLQKEPNFLATLHRQKIILVIVGLR